MAREYWSYLLSPFLHTQASVKTFELLARATDKGAVPLTNTVPVNVMVVSSGSLPPTIIHIEPPKPIPENAPLDTDVATICAQWDLLPFILYCRQCISVPDLVSSSEKVFLFCHIFYKSDETSLNHKKIIFLSLLMWVSYHYCVIFSFQTFSLLYQRGV